MHADINSGAGPKGSPTRDASQTAEARLQKFEKRQAELWRLTFFLLLIVTIVFSWMAWGTLLHEKPHSEALAYTVGLVVLVALFGAYIWKKTTEISELKGLLRGLDQKDSALPSDRQLEQLFEMISKSQQGFRDLIDSFDDLLLALSLDGEIRATNRSFADLLGLPFQKIIGHSLTEFVEDASGGPEDLLDRGMARFLDVRQWNGPVQVRLKGSRSVHYFECVAHAMIR